MHEVESTDRPAAIQLVRASDSHDAALAEFFRVTWNDEATAETVRNARRSMAAENPVSPGEEPPAFLLLKEGKILGYVGTIPIRIWSGGEEHPAHWIKGFWVLAEYRNGPIGFLVLREALRNLSCSLALTVLPVVIGLSVALGFSDLGALPNLVRVVRPGRLLRRIRLDDIGFARLPRWLFRAATLSQRIGLASAGGICAGAVARLAVTARGRYPRSLVVSSGLPDPAEVDALWQRTRATISASLVRDARYLSWRYLRLKADAYRFVTVRKGPDLMALAVVRRPRADGDPRLGGAKVATVSEWIFPLDKPQAGLAALAGAERIAHEFEADALLCTASHTGALSLLRRRAFLAAPPNVHLLTRDRAKTRGLSPVLGDWWITRGDANADEAF
jgi:GNAT superfamily N-acetyltransferase